jgi:hypothetical protein
MKIKTLNLPSWTASLMKERTARKAILKAAEHDYFEIYAMWDRGNAYSVWIHYPSGRWKHMQAGMHSQTEVSIYIRYISRYGDDIRKEISSMSFWDWNDNRYTIPSKMEVLMTIEWIKSIAPNEKMKNRLNEIKRNKFSKAIKEFAFNGVEIEGVGYGWINTHDFENAQAALCLFGGQEDGTEFRVELEKYY